MTAAGVATLDALRAQNIALQVQLSGQERELAQCRHALNLALTKAGSWGSVRSRVVLAKAMNEAPPRAWLRPNAAQHDDKSADAEAQRQTERIIDDLRSQVDAARADAASERELRLAAEQKAAAAASSTAVPIREISENTVAANSNGGNKAPSNAVVAHLMAQIKFLHEEVERLEQAAQDARERGAADHQQAMRQLARDSVAKDREIERLRLDVARARSASSFAAQAGRGGTSRSGRASPTQGDANELEQLRQVHAEERGRLLADKTDLQAQVRKLDGLLKASRQTVAELEKGRDKAGERSAFVEREHHSGLFALSRERDALRDELEAHRRRAATPRFAAEAQTAPPPAVRAAGAQTDNEAPRLAEASCQVDTATLGSLSRLSNSEFDGLSVPAMAHALEVKCGQLDACRAELDDLKKSSAFSGAAMKRLHEALEEEASRRRHSESECERQELQLRALQQQASQLHVALRDAQEDVHKADRKAQEAIAASLRAEEERRVWEAQLASNAKDMDSLVAQHSVAGQQVAAAAAENDGLREELQRALHREAQLQYEAKAKQAELNDVLSAYQQAVREAEGLASNLHALERECDNLRGLIAVRDERIFGLGEQVEDLHRREQQLTMDLQSVDYENGLLHRKLVASENNAGQLDAQATETANALRATQNVIHDFERAHAELHKQLLLKENELMLLRQRCDEAVREAEAATQAHRQLARKAADLEEANARMAVRGLMSRVAQQTADQSVEAVVQELQREKAELEAATRELRAQIDERNRTVDHLTKVLNDENTTVAMLRDEIGDVTEQRDALSAAQARLEALVQRQAEMLAAACDDSAAAA